MSVIVALGQLYLASGALAGGRYDGVALFAGTVLLEVLLGVALWRRPVEAGPDGREWRDPPPPSSTR
jgi:hypothetical protein